MLHIMIDPKQELQTICWMVLNDALRTVPQHQRQQFLEKVFENLLDEDYEHFKFQLDLVPDHLRHGMLAQLLVDTVDYGRPVILAAMMEAMIHSTQCLVTLQ